MASDTKSFRSAVLGFDRSDVIDYIESMAKERRDEVEAHRRAADLLRRERDEALAKITALEEQVVESAQQNQELVAKRILCTELSERLSKINGELIAEREMNERLSESVKEFEREHESIDRAKSLAAELEIVAYKRAEAIEAEAMRNTEKARSMLKKLIADTNSKYSLSRNEAENMAYSVLQELNKMTAWFSEFPRLFDIIDDRMDTMQGNEKPQIKSFVPHQFDSDNSGESTDMEFVPPNAEAEVTFAEPPQAETFEPMERLKIEDMY
jgi:vacuolar-type H+-ATPase subunit I/STV1